MLAKNPAERYASYPAHVEHLSYARTKLLERTTHPDRAKERVVIETQAAKNVSGLLSLGLSIFIAATRSLAIRAKNKLPPAILLRS